MQTSSLVLVLLVTGMLVTGTLNTLSSHWQNSSVSVGIDGNLKNFQHPWYPPFAPHMQMLLIVLIWTGFRLSSCSLARRCVSLPLEL